MSNNTELSREQLELREKLRRVTENGKVVLIREKGDVHNIWLVDLKSNKHIVGFDTDLLIHAALAAPQLSEEQRLALSIGESLALQFPEEIDPESNEKITLTFAPYSMMAKAITEYRALKAQSEPPAPAAPVESVVQMGITTGIQAFAAEQAEQRSKGYTPAHDDTHIGGEIALAGAWYALHESARIENNWDFWPWTSHPKYSPSDRKKEIAKAGALLASEWDRLYRLDGDEPATAAPVVEPVQEPESTGFTYLSNEVLLRRYSSLIDSHQEGITVPEIEAKINKARLEILRRMAESTASLTIEETSGANESAAYFVQCARDSRLYLSFNMAEDYILCRRKQDSSLVTTFKWSKILSWLEAAQPAASPAPAAVEPESTEILNQAFLELGLRTWEHSHITGDQGVMLEFASGALLTAVQPVSDAVLRIREVSDDLRGIQPKPEQAAVEPQPSAPLVDERRAEFLRWVKSSAVRDSTSKDVRFYTSEHGYACDARFTWDEIAAWVEHAPAATPESNKNPIAPPVSLEGLLEKLREAEQKGYRCDPMFITFRNGMCGDWEWSVLGTYLVDLALAAQSESVAPAVAALQAAERELIELGKAYLAFEDQKVICDENEFFGLVYTLTDAEKAARRALRPQAEPAPTEVAERWL